MKCYKIGAIFAAGAFAQGMLIKLPWWLIIIMVICFFALPFVHNYTLLKIEERINPEPKKEAGKK